MASAERIVTDVNSLEDLDKILEKEDSRLVIVKFGAQWCHPCQQLQPHVDLLAQDLEDNARDAVVVCIEKTDDNEDIFEHYEITKLPTVIIFQASEQKHILPRPDPEQLRKEVYAALPLPALVLDDDF